MHRCAFRGILASCLTLEYIIAGGCWNRQGGLGALEEINKQGSE